MSYTYLYKGLYKGGEDAVGKDADGTKNAVRTKNEFKHLIDKLLYN